MPQDPHLKLAAAWRKFKQRLATVRHATTKLTTYAKPR